MVNNNEDNLLASQAEPVKETVAAQTVAIKEAQLTILKGVITDALTQKPLEATIEIVDNQMNQVIATFTSNSATGKYLVSLPAGKNYGIAVKKRRVSFPFREF
jgi:tetrahydromethanopterin S-methyltransferase subunit A